MIMNDACFSQKMCIVYQNVGIHQVDAFAFFDMLVYMLTLFFRRAKTRKYVLALWSYASRDANTYISSVHHVDVGFLR